MSERGFVYIEALYANFNKNVFKTRLCTHFKPVVAGFTMAANFTTIDWSDDDQVKEFIRRMPKTELHAHLNGSLSKATIEKLLKMKGGYTSAEGNTECPPSGGSLSECFAIFKFIQNITDTPSAIYTATRDVIDDFYNDGVCYLELRSTPREIPGKMTRSSYVEALVSAVDSMRQTLPDILVKVLLAIDRRNSTSAAEETLKIAETHFCSGSSTVVGIDLSGDPTVGNVDNFIQVLERAKKTGMKLALHMAEVPNTDREVERLLSLNPDRIGHGTFIHPLKGGCEANFLEVRKKMIPLEICLTSNVISRTISSYEEHHFQLWREIDHPCTLCTDDKGVFNTTLSEEYYLAKRHFSLSPDMLWKFSQSSIDYSFASLAEKEKLKNLWKHSREHAVVTNKTGLHLS